MTDPIAAEVRRLRTVEQLSVAQIQARLGIGRDRVRDMLRGVPPPAWTRRPTAKDDLREQAITLRQQGWSVPDIAERLGVSRSGAYGWVRHLPLDTDAPAARARHEVHVKARADARWGAHRTARDAARAAQHARAADAVGEVDQRDLLLLGAAIYWCEGAKSKPWRRDEQVTFINSDPGLLELFLRFLAACDIGRSVPTYRVSIHETADAEVAVGWWAERLGLPLDRFRRSNIKQHRPVTSRRNVGDDYHGCLVIKVPRSRELYWRIEGMISALFRVPSDTAGS